MNINQTSALTLSKLLEELSDFYPDKIPIHNYLGIEEIRKLQGQQEVIQHIRNMLDNEPDTKDN